jgi:hypothetical protein
MLSYKFIDCSLRFMAGSLKKSVSGDFLYQNNGKGGVSSCPPFNAPAVTAMMTIYLMRSYRIWGGT